jgi:hypothetical protein
LRAERATCEGGRSRRREKPPKTIFDSGTFAIFALPLFDRSDRRGARRDESPRSPRRGGFVIIAAGHSYGVWAGVKNREQADAAAARLIFECAFAFQKRDPAPRRTSR